MQQTTPDPLDLLLLLSLDRSRVSVCGESPVFTDDTLPGQWSPGTEPNLSPQKLSLAGAATSIIFIATNVSSQQTGVCHNKNMFVVTKHVICHNESMLVATNLTLLQQKYACHDKIL